MPRDDGTDFNDFLSAAGEHLTDAHQQLGSGLDFVTGMTLASADLEVKAAVHSVGGRLAISTLPAEEVRLSEVNPELLSTVRLSFVATSLEEEPASRAVPRGTGGPATAPAAESAPAALRSWSEVEATVRARLEEQGLTEVFGDLRLRPAYVPELQRWLVLVENQAGLVLRELVLPDRKPDEGGDG